MGSSSASRSEALARIWRSLASSAGIALPGLAVSRQPLSEALDGFCLGKQLFGNDHQSDLAVELGDRLGRSGPGRSGGLLLERCLQSSLRKRIGKQHDVAKLGQSMLVTTPPGKQRKRFLLPLQTALLSLDGRQMVLNDSPVGPRSCTEPLRALSTRC